MIFITGNCQLKKENSSAEDLLKVGMKIYELKHLIVLSNMLQLYCYKARLGLGLQ